MSLELFRLREKLKRDEPLSMPEQRWVVWRGERAMSGAGDVDRLIGQRLAGSGQCYVCGEHQHGAPHFGCTERYGLNADVQALRAELAALRTQLQQAHALVTEMHEAEKLNTVAQLKSAIAQFANRLALLSPKGGQ